MMVYGWTIFKFSYYVPSWLYFLNVGEILTILAYSVVVNFLESIFILLIVILVSVLLPRKWFAELFITRGSSLSILLLGLMMYVANQFTTKEYYPTEIIHWLPGILILIGILVYYISQVHFLRTVVEMFADRAIIFLYISIPVSALSFIVVVVRNII